MFRAEIIASYNQGRNIVQISVEAKFRSLQQKTNAAICFSALDRASKLDFYRENIGTRYIGYHGA